MRQILALLLLPFVLAARGGELISDSVKVDGHQRTFVIYRPDGLPAEAPLVFVLHGYGGSSNPVGTVCEAADRHGFAACFAQGLKDLSGTPGWNVGYPNQVGWKMDDVKSVCAMARFVQKKYHLSRENTFLSGMSNGGDMCYVMAYSRQQVFKAFCSVAGLTMEWLYKQQRPSMQLPFMEIHGTNDNVSPIEGDLDNRGGWNPFLPVRQAVNAMVTYNRCEIEERDTLVCLDSSTQRPIVRHRYLRGDAGTEVWFYEVLEGTHSWFTEDMNTGEAMWEFFSKYVKKE